MPDESRKCKGACKTVRKGRCETRRRLWTISESRSHLILSAFGRNGDDEKNILETALTQQNRMPRETGW